MRGEEADHAALLDALGLHLLQPVRPRGRYLRGQPVLPRLQCGDAVGVGEVERGPVVRRQLDLGHLRRAQRHRKRLQRQRQPQRLVVGQGAAGGEMAKRAGRHRRVVRVAEHARQLQAGLHLHVDGDRRGILADVVGVVRQRQHLRREPRQQQIRGHVADVARAVERHRFLQRGRQQMQFAAHARLEREVIRMVHGGGGDRRWILRMKVAPPVHVVAQKFHHQLFQQRIVLAVRAEEAGVQRVVARRRRGQRHGRAHASQPCSQPSG